MVEYHEQNAHDTKKKVAKNKKETRFSYQKRNRANYDSGDSWEDASSIDEDESFGENIDNNNIENDLNQY